MINLFIANIKMMLRARQLIFWSMAFPLIFVCIFGLFFGKGNTSAGTVAIINQSKTEIANGYIKAVEDSNMLKVTKDISEAEARELLKKNTIGGIVVIPENFGELTAEAPKNLKVILDPANAQINSVITGFTNAYLTRLDYQINQIKPSFSIQEEKTNQRQLTYFDFVLMGLIGMSLMNSAIQGIAISMANYREDKILKRITTTPLKPWKFVAAEVLSRLVLNFAQISLILAVAYYGFDAHIYGNIFMIFLVSLLGALLFQSIGFMVASVSKTTDSAQGMATAVTVPMMFLTGVFFPIDQLPKWLFSLVQYLPMAPLLKIIRQVGLEEASPLQNPINIIIVFLWILTTLVFSVWKFRLSDE